MSTKKCGGVEEMVGEERGKIRLPLAFVILFAMLAFVSSDCASASTIYVPDDYPTIQQAVDNATDGDTIFVRNGTYPENIRIDKKDLMIEGEDRDTTRIDGGGSGDCVRVSSADVTIRAFTIKNAGNYGVYAYRSDLRINNATIRNCGKDAIYFSYGKSLAFRDSVLENCGGGLIYSAYATGNATIERNSIRNNTGGGLHIYLYGKDGSGGKAVINDNIITNNTGYGIKCDHYSSYYIDSITMRNNTVKNCQYDGVYIEGATDLNITGLIIENAGGDGVYARCYRNMTLKPPFSIKTAGGYGIYAYGPDFTLNNATIRNCGADAIYFYYGKSLTLRDSILENCGGGLIYSAYATGNATIERNSIRNNTGGGLHIYLYGKDGSGDKAVINDNIITNNTGYGIKCDHYSSYYIDSITMRNNTVKNCQYDGVYIEGATDLNITGLIIENAGDDGVYARCYRNMTLKPPFSIKTAGGYGIYAYGPDFTLNNATIRNCGKDAIHFYYGKSLTLRDSILESCGGGLIYYYYGYAMGNAVIERNVIRDNTDDGLYIKLASGKRAVINENIITNNTGSDSDGIYCYISGSGGLVTMKNNTVKNCGDEGVYISGAKYSTLTNNTVSLNGGYGIVLYSSNSNLIFHNNLINNSFSAYDSNPASNEWHHPILLEGNYWSDYMGVDDGSGTGKHAIAGDGIGDTNIPHPGANYDYYPFMNESQWTWPKLNITQAHTGKVAYGLNETVTISCVVQNETGVNSSVDNVNAKIIKPDSSAERITLSEEFIGNYNGIFSNTSLFGTYNVTISANKVGYVRDTATLDFDVLPEHDIAVTTMDAPSSTEVNSTIIVNATISNIGLNNESDITVDFMVDGVKQSYKTIPFLKSSSYTTIRFQWTVPSVAGMRNITIYAEPVAHETIVWNNRLNKTISVITIPDIWVYPESFDFVVKRGEVECDNLTIGNNGTGALIFNMKTEARASSSTSLSNYQISTKYTDTQIIFEQEFRKPDIEKIEIDKVEYDRVTIPGLPKTFKTGEPVLPVKNVQILLPYEKDVQSIEIRGKKHDLVGTYYVEPGEPPVPIGIPLKEPPKIAPNETIYSSTEPYPGLYEASVQSLRGYRILILNLYPVHYTPNPGTISYYTDLEIVINTKPGVNSLYRGLSRDRERAIQVVDNPEFADTYPLNTKIAPSYDHVIITSNSFARVFQRLADWKTRRGIRSQVVTVEYINLTFPGRDLQEKIRNYIIHAYLNEGIEYVLLGGDADGADIGGETGPIVVPARGFYAVVGINVDDNIPADLYYAALDGSWNDDNDTRWGEPGEDDLYAEVYVGRAPVDSETEVSNFIMKTIAYESANDPYLKSALMVGEFLWSSPATYGGDYKDEMKDGSCACGYCTIGFPADYNVSTLYDRDHPGHDWPKSVLIDTINNNTPHIINHLGHSSTCTVMKLTNAPLGWGCARSGYTDVDDLINDKYFFAYSQGCYPGSFDNWCYHGYYTKADSVAEHFVTSDHGAFAFIGNTRYGWGKQGSTCGPSQYYDRQFYDAIFGENTTNIGKANQDSKEDNNGYIDQDAMRWCYYQLTLFGDPETSLVPTAVPWLSVSPDNGTVGGDGDSTNVSVCVNATHLEAGVYNASIIIKNNDPDENPVEVPVNFTVIPPEHDIAVTNLSASEVVEVTSNISVNATVCNLGSNDEILIVVDLIVDEIIKDTTTITSLASGSCTNVSFTWTVPGVEGEHNLTVYLEPVTGEKILWNNMMSKTISVITIPDIGVYPEAFNVTLEKGEVINKTITVSNNGSGTLNFNITLMSAITSLDALGRTNYTTSRSKFDTSLLQYEHKPGELFVKYLKNVSVSDIEEFYRSLNATLLKNYPKIGYHLIQVDDSKLEETIELLAKSGLFETAEPNYLLKAIEIPDDPRFNELWGMHNTGQTGGTADADIDAIEAWDIFTGTKRVIVAVIDTGVDYNHEDLADNMWTNPGEIPGNGIDDDGNGFVDDYYGWDFAYNDNDPSDGYSHGTHCSGTIGGVGDNGVGVAGVSWAVSIMAVKFLDDAGWGSTSDAIAAITYAIMMDADIMSNSWGGGGYSSALEATIQSANNAGILFVASAGNDAANTDLYPHYPSCYDVPNVMSIAATDHNDALAYFSNYGNLTVDLGAPGDSILSSVPGNGYSSYSGTSMAAPHVAGAAALLKAFNPALTHLEIKNIVMTSVDSLPSLYGKTVTGGRLNSHKAVTSVSPKWLSVRPTNGSVPVGGQITITVVINATSLNVDTYNATIVIKNNDPDENPTNVPVNLRVVTLPHIISFSPTNRTPTQYVDTAYTFNVTMDQVMTSNWWFILPEEITTPGNGTSSMTIAWKCAGIYNVTYTGTNENGSVTITWIVTVLEPPTIRDWYNNKTKNNSTSITVNISEAIYLNASANQSIDIWNWFKDGINQNNNYDNFSTRWSEKEEYTVSVNASNVNGTSNTVRWHVSVKPIASMNDLIITDTWICSENCTICYDIINIGNGTTPAGHNTTLFVDDDEVARDYVPVDLEPNGNYIGCFKDYNWAYTAPKDTITVCADADETVDESNETNNCLETIWMCGDVNCNEVVDMSDVIDLMYYVGYPGHYTICNQWAADVNCDKHIDRSDVIDLQYYVGYPGQYELKCWSIEISG